MNLDDEERLWLRASLRPATEPEEIQFQRDEDALDPPIIARLVARGLIHEVPSPPGRRFFRATADGRAVAEQLGIAWARA